MYIEKVVYLYVSTVMDKPSGVLSNQEWIHVNEVTSMDLPMDWDNFYLSDVDTEVNSVESVSDGLIKSLNKFARVDIEYISAITGKDYKDVIRELRGSIYQNPATWGECFFMGWETAEEYLSGNIRAKLVEAIKSNKEYNGYFQDNVDALKKVFPANLSQTDIYVTLGSPWIPVEIIRDFIFYLDKDNRSYYYQHWRNVVNTVTHDEVTGTWEIRNNMISYVCQEKYGTKRRAMSDILLRTLNMKNVAVYDTEKSDLTKSGFVKVLNRDETVMALEKQKALIKEFQNWVWKDFDRKNKLISTYVELFGSTKQRHFDGSFLEFPTMNPAVKLFPYQKNAVARILFSANTLLAHDVGSGKTYVMIAAGMEQKRMGISKKNLYVIPNNLIGQWKEIFLEMYPGAKLLCVDSKSFTPDKREAVLEKICNEEYDGILMAYSCFSMIPISIQCELDMLDEELADLQKMTRDPKKNNSSVFRAIDRLQNKRRELVDAREKNAITFDQLGIERLYVDEAHNFKNVPIDSKVERVMGISKTGSKKCADMMRKVRIVQKKNDGKGVVMATGTPITNSITDAYIMQSYLQNGEMALLEIQNFDSWIGMFAERATSFEIDVDTSSYRLATRFSKFHNIPELTTMLANIADFHQVDETAGIPKHNGYVDIVVPRTPGFSEYLKSISYRADQVRKGKVRRNEDNLLKITTDGRKAALDLRLVDDKAGFVTNSKVYQCAKAVANIYHNTSVNRSTQLVFCDSSTPKDGFNMYDELRRLLLEMDVKDEEIVYIHDATTESKREKIFKNMQKGNIRVLIGSTFKLGLGVNVQNKLIALHHLDVPWRPADMVQREGRILRQGNENPVVEIYRYITEGSFDAYSWQLLETKQGFITDLLSGSIEKRSGSDVDDTVLNYAEIKALAIGNPLIKERVETANELSRYQLLQKKLLATRVQYEQELIDMPGEIERLKNTIPKCKKDADTYYNRTTTYTEDELKEIRHRIFVATHPDEPSAEEVEILEYHGFKIVAPSKVSQNFAVCWICGEDKYMVEMTTTEQGSMNRIDRYLADLDKKHASMCSNLNLLLEKQEFMQNELLKENDYLDEIERCQLKIKEIDAQLGVEEDEDK